MFKPLVSMTTVNNSSLSSAHTSKAVAYEAKMPLTSRRDFLQRLAASACATAYLSHQTAKATAQPATSGTDGNPVRTMKTESDVGSLFPFIQSQAVKSDFSTRGSRATKPGSVKPGANSWNCCIMRPLPATPNRKS